MDAIMDVKYGAAKLSERFWTKLAWMVPRKLAYWCAIRVISNATVGEYENQVVPELSAIDALKRWDMK